ncbi:cytidylate kinase-like family protein [uncultured Desulfobacter sp.]|uniref:cytidylate kinase-like family protein n=1 Tax=uncultured Desulfobacter sp. TaxID=240139 RepID=UPI0029F475C4|nr:cytidylate kinase-like family protein [uncultured Desulfobacter sp.]
MKKTSDETVYPPGYYGRKMMNAADWAGTQVRQWERAQAERKKGKDFSQKPCICLSRGIGAGALEVAEFLSKRTGYPVIDKEIIEHMAKDSSLTEKIIKFFDERLPGKMNELLVALSIEKKFLANDYVKQLAKTVTALSHTDPTIFVGRGTHLILPRHSILSVQLVCNKKRRIEKLAIMLDIDKSEAEKRLNIIDEEHHEFFKAVYLREKISSDEFDLIINMDHIKSEHQVAQIIACAFEQKFQVHLKNK